MIPCQACSHCVIKKKIYIYIFCNEIHTEFASVDRTTVQAADVGHTDEDEFDTTIHGPWMKRWEIVHHNRHTASMLSHTEGTEPPTYKP